VPDGLRTSSAAARISSPLIPPVLVEAKRSGAIVDLLRAGKSVALVTDASTPGVELAATPGDDRPIVIARELTKKFETIARMPLSEAVAWLEADANRMRGEFVLVVDASGEVVGEVPFDVERLRRALALELAPAWAARVAAAATGEPRDILYEPTSACGR